MNIDFTSDLHSSFVYNKNKTFFGKNGLLKQKNDYLIIAGDINEDIDIMQKTFDEIIQNTDYQKIIITFGNHDIRYHHNDMKYDIKNSIEKYFFIINFFHNYKNKIHVIDIRDYFLENEKIIITGNMGWYNYTINELDKHYLQKYFDVNFDKLSFGHFKSNDKVYIEFNQEISGNIQLSNYLEKSLEKRFEKISNSNNHILAISHVKPSNLLEKKGEYYLSYNENKWQEIIKEIDNPIGKYSLATIYSNAFYINDNLSKIYEKYGVKYAVYGHTHYKGEQEINSILYKTNAFGYY